jgi:uncharacterized protein YkwD
MYRSYLLGLLVVTAIAAALTGLIGGHQVDEVAVLSIQIPEPVSTTWFDPAPTTAPTTVPFVEHDGDANDLLTTTSTVTTTTTLATSTTVATTAAPKKPPATQPKKAAPPPSSTKAGYNSGYEADFASAINGYRSSEGLAKLSRDGSLDAEARAWSKRMATRGNLSHSDLGRFLPPWSAAGENVGTGGSVSGLFDALVGSSGHRANMLGGYTHFGVGVWVDESGTLWTTHVFTG